MRLMLIFSIIFSYLSTYSQQSPKDNILFNAFKQGTINGGGNCASIALIKASIGTFGIGNVFSYSDDSRDSMIIVKLKNDSIISIKYADISEASKQNGFKIKSLGEEAEKIKRYADTCFAVMVKMNEIIWRYPTFKESLEALLNGYFTPSVNNLLGLKFKEISTRWDTLKENRNVVFYNTYHAVYSSFGYYDETKNTNGYSLNENFKKNRFGYKCSWYLCNPRSAFIIIK